MQFSKDLSEAAQAKALRETRCQVDSVAMETLRNQVYQELASAHLFDFAELVIAISTVLAALSDKCTVQHGSACSVLSAC